MLRRDLLAASIVGAILPLRGTRAAETRRVVAVGGAITETVYALGCQDGLVGVDTTSQFPAEARHLPQVGYLRQLSAEGILSLSPELVIAAAEAGPPSVFDHLRQFGVPVERLSDDYSPEGVAEHVRRVGTVLGVSAAAQVLADRLRDEIEQIRQTVAALPQRSVLFLLGMGRGAPLAAGRATAADQMIRLAGGRNVMAGAYTGYKPVSAEAVAERAPERIVTTTQTLEVFGGQPERLLAQAGLALTPAARQERVAAFDALYLLGFGPRTPAALRDLVAALHG